MPKRPQAGSAAAGSDADAKKTKPHVCVSSHAIRIPPNTEPESRKLSGGCASQRAAREADENATEVLHIKLPRGVVSEAVRTASFELFAKPFEAAVASACAKWHRPVTLNEVITEIAKTGCKLKIGKQLKEQYVWKGFNGGRWVISRVQKSGLDPVAYPKDAAMPSRSKDWRFSPSPAARRPLAKLSCEPSPR